MIEFRVLGSLSVTINGVPAELGTPMLRKLLAVLLCRGGAAIGVEALAEAVWPHQRPPSYRKTVQVYVRRLRLLLGDNARISLTGAGYCLVVRPGELDTEMFAGLVARGRAGRDSGDLAVAAALLAEALSVWRGAAYADIAEVPEVGQQAESLDRQRIGVFEDWCELEIELGRHDHLLDQLSASVRAHPYRERLREQLMIVLYRSGQRAEALEEFRQARATLAQELGVEPGPRLQRLHIAILRDEDVNSVAADGRSRTSPANAGGARTVPRELPADVVGFAGRTVELAALQGLAPGRQNGVTISAIAGMAGIGKTALAVRWAHQMADQFPDGQVYLNLNGSSETPAVRPIDALASLLRSLGEPAEKVPYELDEAAARYRSMLADRRVLILLDNVASAEQVRPLLPGSRDSVVLITSQNRLSGLVAREGVRRITLDLLSPADARLLLVEAIGARRVAAEPAATMELARLCAYLPLALRIAAAQLADQPQRLVSSYVDALRGADLLSALAIEDDETAAVRAAFDLSYRDVPPAAKHVFRMLGLEPARDFTPAGVAALAGITHREAEHRLTQLAAAHLLWQPQPGRYTLHDLLRLYAQERVAVEETKADVQAAVERIYAWRLLSVDAATKLLFPQMLRLPLPRLVSVDAMAFSGLVEAMAWLDNERVNLVASIEHAARAGLREMSWLLADGLRGYLARRRHLVDWFSVAERGLAEADAAGVVIAQAAAHLSLGHANRSRCDYPKAIMHIQLGIELSERAGWMPGAATCLSNLASLYYEIGDLDESLALNGQVQRMSPEAWRLGLSATMGMNMGLALREKGRLAESLAVTTEATEVFERMRTPSSMAVSHENLGVTLHQLGRFGQAQQHLDAALALKRQLGDRRAQAYTEASLAALHCDLGRIGSASQHAQQALMLARDADDRRVESIALSVAGVVRLASGQHFQAAHRYEIAAVIADGIGARFPALVARIGLATARFRLGELEEALLDATELARAAAEHGYLILEGEALALLARVQLARIRPTEAMTQVMAAVGAFRRSGHRLGEARALAVRADVRDLQGDGVAVADRQAALALFAEIGAPLPVVPACTDPMVFTDSGCQWIAHSVPA